MNVSQIDIEIFQRVGDFGFDFKSAALFDSSISLSINWNYNTTDDFVIKIPLISENVELFTTDNILLLQGQFFYIDRVIVEKDEDGFITVYGKSMASKMSSRIIDKTYMTDSKLPENIVFELINDNVVHSKDVKRNIDYLTLDKISTVTSEKIAYQKSYGNILEEVTALMNTYDFGIKEVPIDYVNPKQQIKIFKGKDLSDLVEFSKDFENLSQEKYENSNYDESSTAYVLGEGEGESRKGIYIGDSLSGIERREMYVDARDLQHTVRNEDGTETELNDDQYTQALIQRGKDKLSVRRRVLEINGKVNLSSDLFQFRRDYNVGDRVRISSKLFNTSKTAVLSSVEETWDENGYSMIPTFGNESPTIQDIIKRGGK